MISNKLLVIEGCCFNLPDDFNGTVGEALKLLSEYRLQTELDNSVSNGSQDLYGDLIKNDNIRVAIGYAFYQLDDEGNYKRIETMAQLTEDN